MGEASTFSPRRLWTCGRRGVTALEDQVVSPGQVATSPKSVVGEVGSSQTGVVSAGQVATMRCAEGQVASRWSCESARVCRSEECRAVIGFQWK